MSFEPQKFFIGLVDFFSILLPGALLTYLLRDEWPRQVLGRAYSTLPPTEGGLVFLFVSYLLGHFIFLLGAWLLDDYCYDPLRKATHWEQIKRLSEGKSLSSRCLRQLARFFFKSDIDLSLRKAVRIKEHYLAPLGASSAVNAFQWTKALLTTQSPEALATVQRFEADGKFFRSFVVTLLILIPAAFVNRNPIVAISLILFLLLALWRYIDQRSKSTSQAYWHVITREAASPTGFRASPPNTTLPTHAGGVVFQERRGTIQYLLVEATKSSGEWVLPKGHIDPEECSKETAVREVREETGVWASVRADLECVSFTSDDEIVRSRFYLMQGLTEEHPTDVGRQHRWLPLDAAISQTRHTETHDLLRQADKKRSSLQRR